MNQWINYHHLFYFKAIAEEGTVSKAAEKLRLGQPTLSAQLKQLEDNLGVQLFYNIFSILDVCFGNKDHAPFMYHRILCRCYTP